jgi:hypothetical protein
MIIGIHHPNLRYIFHITTLFNFFYFEVISKRANRYLIHLFQGLKCLTLPIIETYSPWTYTCINICHFSFFKIQYKYNKDSLNKLQCINITFKLQNKVA